MMRPLLGREPNWLAATCARALAVLVTIASLASAPGAQAAPGGLIVIPRPSSNTGLSYFKVSPAPGTTSRLGVVELKNTSAKTLRVVLSRVDGQTLNSLGSGYAPPGSKPHGAALWLGVGQREVTLVPGARLAVPVTLEVPPAAGAGDYLSGISIEALDQTVLSVPKRGASIASASRYAIGVEISLPGPRTAKIRFTGVRIERQPAGLVFVLAARNPGNVILQGVHGGVRISKGGHVVLSRAIAPGTFVSATSISYPVTAFGQLPSEGTRYDISAWLRYPGGIARLSTHAVFGHRQAALQQVYARAPATTTRSSGLSWWVITLIAAAVLYGMVMTVLLLRGRGRGQPRSAAPPSEQPGVELSRAREQDSQRV